MTTPQNTDPSMLILKMVGGELDGKLLPIGTQKCFLTGGNNSDSGQCAIIRGPSGTALRAVDTEVYVNGTPDTVHWLKMGDAIAIGEMRMVVVQLGYYPQTESPETQTNAKSTEPATATAAATTSTTTAAPQSMQQPETAAQAVGETVKPTDKGQSTPQACTDLSETQRKANEERLERALQSLSEHETTAEPVTSTESLVNERLNNLENELEAHDKSFSEPMPIAPGAPLDTQAKTQIKTETEAKAEVETEAEAEVETEDQFESTAKDALNALPPLSTPTRTETPEEAVAEEPTQETVKSEQSVESASVEQNDEASVTDAEQTKLDEIMARLGVAANKPSEPTPEIVPSDSESPSVREKPKTVPADSEKPVTPPRRTRAIAPTIMQVPNSELFQSDEDEAAVTSTPIAETPSELPSVKTLMDEATKSDLPVEPTPEDSTSETPASDKLVSTVEESTVEEATEESTVEAASVEEEATEKPTEEKPEGQSVADILARMKSEGKLDQFEDPTQDDKGQAAQTPVETAPIAQPETAKPETAQPATDQAEEGEANVQDYMDQLFQRLRGGESDDAAPAEAKPAPKPVVEDPEVKAQPAVKEQPKPQQVLSAEEYVPQRKAPEEQAAMRAMRQLANKQKSTAVSKSFQNKSKIIQAISTYVAGGAFAGTLAFAWIAESFGDPAGILSVTCFIVSMIALHRYVVNQKNIKEANLEEPEQG